MSIDMAIEHTAQLPAAGAAVADAWGLADALTVGAITSAAADLVVDGQAVLASFSGAASGDLVLAVDHEIAQQLMDSPAAPVDLIAALTPAITAALMSFGDLSITASEVLHPQAAADRVLATDRAAGVCLTDDGEVRATVIIGVQPVSVPGPRVAGGSPAVAPAPTHSVDRLDLLRGVQMEATVQLGRTEMTINDLLSLRSGAVIELDRAAGAPADLFVNGRLIARGEVVVVDENYGLRIQQVIADEPGR